MDELIDTLLSIIVAIGLFSCVTYAVIVGV